MLSMYVHKHAWRRNKMLISVHVIYDCVDYILTDSLFLLAFLRVGKFSQLKARERLGNFISALTHQVTGITGHDPADPDSLKIIRE